MLKRVAIMGLIALAAGCGAFESEEVKREAEQARFLQDIYPNDPAYFNNSIGNEVYFASGSHALTDAAKATLAQQARWLVVNTDYTLVVEGYADERGTYGYNRPLAARRSTEVVTYLRNQGLGRDRVVNGVTFGKEDPARLCEEPACLAENRRAVSRLVSADLL